MMISDILLCENNEDVLLVDCVEAPVFKLDEVSADGKIVFRGKFQEAESVNKNKRMYPRVVLDENVKKLEETINNHGLVGELDHPADSIIHFENASHLITKLWWESNSLMGEGVILDTPAGKVLKSLTNSGVRWGISSRGVGNGSVNNEGVLVIGESYRLITFDAVADPSTFSAFQKRVSTKEVISPTPTSDNYVKNENKRIDRLDANALISYLGHIVQKRTDEIKERLHK